jgi:hypothetical protein
MTMHLRRCDRCRDLKPVSEFNLRRKGARRQRDNYCRTCRAEYLREHYARHKDRYVAEAVRRKKELAIERAGYLIAFFRARPCADCGEDDPLVLEFDHLADKTFNITKGITAHSWQAVRDEIAKCDVVCANCHRRRTASRAGSIRFALAQGQQPSRAAGCDTGGSSERTRQRDQAGDESRTRS